MLNALRLIFPIFWWQKSSLSFSNGNCVYVARLFGIVGIVDSRRPWRVLFVPAADYREFTASLVKGTQPAGRIRATLASGTWTIHDTGRRWGPSLLVSYADFEAFIGGLKQDELSLGLAPAFG